LSIHHESLEYDGLTPSHSSLASRSGLEKCAVVAVQTGVGLAVRQIAFGQRRAKHEMRGMVGVSVS